MYSFHPESCWVLFNFNPGADCSLYEMTLVPFSNNLLQCYLWLANFNQSGRTAIVQHRFIQG